MWCEMPAYYTALQFSSSEGCLIRNKATVYAHVTFIDKENYKKSFDHFNNHCDISYDYISTSHRMHIKLLAKLLFCPF